MIVGWVCVAYFYWKVKETLDVSHLKICLNSASLSMLANIIIFFAGINDHDVCDDSTLIIVGLIALGCFLYLPIALLIEAEVEDRTKSEQQSRIE